MVDESERIGDRVYRLRRALGISQETLAHRAGVTKNQISLVEKGGIQRPRPDNIRRLAKALGVSPLYLEKGIELPPTDGGTWLDIEAWARGRREIRSEDHLRFLRETYDMLMELERLQEDTGGGER